MPVLKNYVQNTYRNPSMWCRHHTIASSFSQQSILQNSTVPWRTEETMSDIPEQKNIAGGLAIRTIDDLGRLSNMLAKSGFFADAREAAQCGVKVLCGLELGFPTIASMCGVHIVNGKPTLGAHLMAAAIKRSGKYDYKITRHDNDGCTLVFYENGEVVGESTFTKDDARTAGALDGKNAHSWKKFPRNMMFARAMSNGVRWFCPDIFTGAVYTPDEMDAVTDEEGNMVTTPVTVQTVEAHIEPEPTPQPQPQPQNGNHPHNARIKAIRTLLEMDGYVVQEQIKTEYLASTPAELQPEQLQHLILWMATEWGQRQGMNYHHAKNSFNKHVSAMIAGGYDELEAIRQWTQHAAQQPVTAE
jgi:hypothetical protein